MPDAGLCALHGWEQRTMEPEVWDAVLFTTELDLLEIRWHELDSVVDKFFLLENNGAPALYLRVLGMTPLAAVTFTGRPKREDFALHRARFAQFEHKVVYKSLAGTIAPNVEPFVVEGEHRAAMTSLLRAHLSSTKNGRNPLVIFSDTDELPAAHTIRLLKKCSFASPLHLRMRTFLYSFEWPYGDSSWRAQVHDWAFKLTNYGHSLQSDVALADAGWHCSFVLLLRGRTLPLMYCADFVSVTSTSLLRRCKASHCTRSVNMLADSRTSGYSHADRIGGVKDILQPSHIQEVICRGKDIFNMLPEVSRACRLVSADIDTLRRLTLCVLQSLQYLAFVLIFGKYKDLISLMNLEP